MVVLLASCFEPPRPPCYLVEPASASCPALHDAGPDAYDPPSTTLLVPSSEENDVPIDTTVRVTFDRPVVGVSPASFMLFENDDIDAAPASVGYDDISHVATLVPDLPLLSSTRYLAKLGPEITGVDRVALVGTTSWTFITAGDVTPPQVTMQYPSAGATGVGVDVVLVAGFSEQISNITGSTFVVADANGQLPATIGYVSQTAVSLEPKAQLVGHTTYTATLTAGIHDFGGNVLLGAPVTWTFTTGDDTVPPDIDSVVPSEDEPDVPISIPIRVRFTEPVVGVSASTFTLQAGGIPVAASVTYTAATRRADLVPDAALAPATQYTATIGPGITDLGGNAAPAKTWTFTTE